MLYAEPPREPITLADCAFYHVQEIPGSHVKTNGPWDLRSSLDAYLGNTKFMGKRVLEIGPASGYLTFEMEKRGASVVAVEVPESHGWDYVPYPAERLSPILENRAIGMRMMHNSWWFLHGINRSKARLTYADIYDLPDDLGRFDIAIMTSVLLHLHSPLQVISQCAKRADMLVITDMLFPQLEGRAIMELNPTAENFGWDLWWRFSSDLIVQFVNVLGYRDIAISHHSHRYAATGADAPFFTVVARR